MEGYARKEKIRINVLNKQEQKKHFHQDIELIYVLNGKVDVMIDEQVTSLQAEDIYIINPNKLHQLIMSDDVLYAQLSIAYELISDVLKSIEFMFWCDSTNNQSEEIEKLRINIRKLLNQYLHGQEGIASFYHISLCYQMLDILTMHFLVRSVDREKNDEKDKFEERLTMINNYIWANYNQAISLQELSDKLYLSNAYLSRFFKKNYGMSFAKYVNNIRLYHAVDELLFSNTPITRIAYDNGFPSVTAFNKAFKEEYGETPSKIRKKASRTEKDKDSLDVQKEIDRRLEEYLINNNNQEEEDINTKEYKSQYNVNMTKLLYPVWNQLINIGAAEEILRSEVQEHILLLKNNLDFKYVRFWNCFSKKLFIDIHSPVGEYNFSRLDAILDFLIEQELRPHIELSYKPKRIHKSVQTALVFEHNESSSVDIHSWRRIMSAFMDHIVRRYGRREIDTWRLEMWADEQRLDSKKVIQEYYNIFSTTYEIVRKYSKNIEIGGCGIQTGYALNINQDFLYNWSQQKYTPDFISIMNYAYVRGKENKEKYSKRNTDNSCLLHAIENIKNDLEIVGLENTKLLVTEWNLTISDRNYINDTCFKGAYIIKNMIDVYGKIETLGYFLASDCVSEYYDSTMILHGGTGLISKDSIFKPAAFAYQFLSQLQPYYIGKDEHHLVTSDHHHSYAIIAHNQKNLNYQYYYTGEEDIEKEHIWKYFEDRDCMQDSIELKAVENGEYQIKIQRINEENGSVLDGWKEMDFYQQLSLNDIKYLRKRCYPKLTIQKVKVENNSLNIKLSLEPNEITLIKIRKV